MIEIKHFASDFSILLIEPFKIWAVLAAKQAISVREAAIQALAQISEKGNQQAISAVSAKLEDINECNKIKRPQGHYD